MQVNHFNNRYSMKIFILIVWLTLVKDISSECPQTQRFFKIQNRFFNGNMACRFAKQQHTQFQENLITPSNQHFFVVFAINIALVSIWVIAFLCSFSRAPNLILLGLNLQVRKINLHRISMAFICQLQSIEKVFLF